MNDKNFIINLTHDLKTPMNSIIGFTDLALSIEENEKVKEYLNKISIASNHLLAIVNNLLDLSKIDNGKLTIKNEYYSLNEIIKEVNDILSNVINIFTNLREKRLESQSLHNFSFGNSSIKRLEGGIYNGNLALNFSVKEL